MRSLSVRAKLMFGFGVLSVITLLLGGASYRGILVIDDAANEIDRQTEEHTASDGVALLVLKEEAAARGFLLTGDERELEKYESAKRDYGKLDDEPTTKIQSEEGKRLFGQVKRAHETYMTVTARENQLKRVGKQSAA